MDHPTTITNNLTEKRTDPRFGAFSRLYVRGINAYGKPFSETCEMIDISQGGISWLMESPVWLDMLITLDFFYPHPADSPPVLRRKGTARVLRVDESDDGRYLVAACFERLASFEGEGPDEITLHNMAAPDDW